MELYDESIDNQKKNRKIYIGLIIGMAILVLLILIIISLIIYLKGTVWTYEFNGANSTELKDIVIRDEKDKSKLYVPIRKMAEFAGYSSHRGDYINLSEEDSKCYVVTENEIIMFTENSNIIYKLSKTTNTVLDNKDIEPIEISEPIILKDSELCTTIEGIEKALNMVISYNNDEQFLKAYTLEYLYGTYEENASKYGYDTLSTNFMNEKGLLENILVGKNTEGLYGAYDLKTKKVILENKYKDVEFISKTGDFLVTSTSDKKGIITREQKNKININYDNVELITENDKLYYKVTSNNNIGLIDTEGNIIFNAVVSNKYNKIGIDASDFKVNGIENGYVLLNKLIPVKDNKELWGFVSKTTGELVIECKYNSLGCINEDEKENVLVIESQEVIVVSNGSKYDVITTNGDSIYNMLLDSVYVEVDEKGKETYYLTSGNQKVDAEENISKKIR